MGIGAYHVESHDILEGDLAGPVALDKNLIDDLGTAASRKTQDERIGFGWVESLDTA